LIDKEVVYYVYVLTFLKPIFVTNINFSIYTIKVTNPSPAPNRIHHANPKGQLSSLQPFFCQSISLPLYIS